MSNLNTEERNSINTVSTTFAAWERNQRLSPFVTIHTELSMNGKVVSAWTNFGDTWGIYSSKAHPPTPYGE